MVRRFNKWICVVIAFGFVLLVSAIVWMISTGAVGNFVPPTSTVPDVRDRDSTTGQQSVQGAGSRATPGPPVNIDPGMDTDFRKRLLDDVTDAMLSEAMKNPGSLVKLRFLGAAPYHSLAKSFDVQSLSQFYQVLKDKNASGYEKDQAVLFIGQIGQRGDPGATKALSEFLTQSVNWEKWQHDKRQVDLLVISKFHALEFLGYIGTDEAQAILQDAITSEGASLMAKDWIEGVPSFAFAKAAVVDNLRGFAAKGLAFNDKEAALKIIVGEYARERQACLNAGVTESDYFYQLCDAMARIDVVKEIGLDAHRALYDGSGAYSTVYGKHVRKYLLRESVPVIEKTP